MNSSETTATTTTHTTTTNSGPLDLRIHRLVSLKQINWEEDLGIASIAAGLVSDIKM